MPIIRRQVIRRRITCNAQFQASALGTVPVTIAKSLGLGTQAGEKAPTLLSFDMLQTEPNEERISQIATDIVHVRASRNLRRNTILIETECFILNTCIRTLVLVM